VTSGISFSTSVVLPLPEYPANPNIFISFDPVGKDFILAVRAAGAALIHPEPAWPVPAVRPRFTRKS